MIPGATGPVRTQTSDDGTPLVIHNIGRGTREEDSLFTFPLTGHFRWFRSTDPE